MLNRRHEWSRYYKLDEVAPVEVLHAHFVTHRYPRHVHDYFVIGLVESGAQSYFYRGARHTTPAGHVFLVNPGEPHTGESAAAGGYVYRTLYLHGDVLARSAADVGRPSRVPFFTPAVVDDPRLAVLLARFHHCVAQGSRASEQGELLLGALTRVVLRHTGAGGTARPVGRERPAVRHAREYMEACFARNVSLAELAAVTALSPYHLARAFTREIGVAPHAYLEGVRVRKARECLDRGVSIATAAVTVGYSDQSHLTRRFRRFLGITPGQYVRGKQDSTRRGDAAAR